MKKALLIGCSVLGAIAVIVVLACGGLTIFGGQKYMANNTAVVESMIGNKVPAGFMPVFAMDLAKTDPNGEFTKIALLMYQSTQSVMIAEGPVIPDDQKEAFFAKMQSQGSKGSAGENMSIQKAGEIIVAGQSCPKFSLTGTSSAGKQTKGIATFVNLPGKTFYFMYFSPAELYDENVPGTFLNAIQVQPAQAAPVNAAPVNAAT